MYILQEENKDLREDLERLQKLSYDDKIKEMAEENLVLRKRNGDLIMQLEQAKRTIAELKKAGSSTASESVITRPQTASIMGRKKDDFLLNDEDLQEAQS